MNIVHIETQKRVKKSKKEYQRDLNACKNEISKTLVSEYKFIPSKEPTYIVEMSAQELQLVSFYLELEKRAPIVNLKLGDKENKNEQRIRCTRKING